LEPSEPGGPWRIKNPKELNAWAFSSDATMEEGLAVLEFVRDRILQDPDFGEEIAEHTRGDVAPHTTREVIWTFNPRLRWVEIITPFDVS
jgi:hypothetical protein